MKYVWLVGANAVDTDRPFLQLGYTATPANLLTVPVYALACIMTCLVGFVADRYGQRGYLNM